MGKAAKFLQYMLLGRKNKALARHIAVSEKKSTRGFATFLIYIYMTVTTERLPKQNLINFLACENQ